jgi:hypothetical protein
MLVILTMWYVSVSVCVCGVVVNGRRVVVVAIEV